MTDTPASPISIESFIPLDGATSAKAVTVGMDGTKIEFFLPLPGDDPTMTVLRGLEPVKSHECKFHECILNYETNDMAKILEILVFHLNGEYESGEDTAKIESLIARLLWKEYHNDSRIRTNTVYVFANEKESRTAFGVKTGETKEDMWVYYPPPSLE